MKDMLTCEQTKGQNIYQHGLSVQRYCWQLIQALGNGEPGSLRLPPWLLDNARFLLDNIHDWDTISIYALYHDCGKPYCLEIDVEGHRHFPNHAEISKNIFLEISDYSEKSKIADLIGWDMAIHTSSAEDINNFLENEWTKADATTLILSALAEVHSNAALFGGIESISFKAKWKKIVRRSKQIFNFFQKEGKKNV